MHQRLIRHAQLDDDQRVAAGQDLVERFCLRDGAWESVQDEAVPRIVARQTLAHDLDDQRIADQLAALHDCLRLPSEVGSRLDRFAQDVPGRYLRDAALLLGVMAGHDRRDAFGVAEPAPDFLAACDAGAEGLRIAWSPTLGYAQPEPEVAALCEAAARRFEALGCTVELVEDALGDDPVELWMAEFYGGIGTKLKDLMAERPDELDPAVVATLSAGLDRSMVEFFTQVFARYEFREQMRQLFERYDLLLSPTLPCAAFDVGHDTPPGLGARNIVSWVYYTYPFNLTGQPAASIPAGFTASGLPVGLQMVAGINSEVDILRAAAAFEEAAPWADRRPPLA